MGFLWWEPTASLPFSTAKFLCFITSFINKAFANSSASTNTVLVVIFPTQMLSSSSVPAWNSTALVLGFKVSCCLLPFLACILILLSLDPPYFPFMNFIFLIELLSHLFCLLLWCGIKDGSPMWIFPVPGHLPLLMELPLAVTEQGSYFPPSSPLQSHF